MPKLSNILNTLLQYVATILRLRSQPVRNKKQIIYIDACAPNSYVTDEGGYNNPFPRSDKRLRRYYLIKLPPQAIRGDLGALRAPGGVTWQPERSSLRGQISLRKRKVIERLAWNTGRKVNTTCVMDELLARETNVELTQQIRKYNYVVINSRNLLRNNTLQNNSNRRHFVNI